MHEVDLEATMREWGKKWTSGKNDQVLKVKQDSQESTVVLLC